MLHRTVSLIIASLLLITAISTQANNSPICPKPTSQPLSKETTIFFYQRFKKNQTLYIPVMMMQDNKLTPIGKKLMPAEVTLFSLRNDQPVKIRFYNTYNPMEMTCQSIGETQTATEKKNALPTELYANKPSAKVFNFSPESVDLTRFSTSIKNPCKNGKPQYDKMGVAACNADQLLATSHLLYEKQYWQLRQYRHDVGLVISSWDKKTQSFKPFIEDCTECID